MSALARRNGDVSFWHAELPPAMRRPPLPGDRAADVCIAGAGYTGLWTAYELKRARPQLDVVVLEREHAGFGASGRNGGWLTSAFAAPRDRLARAHGREAAVRLDRALRDSLDAVLATCAAEGIEADVARGGVLRIARNAAQAARLRAHVAAERDWGVAEEDLAWLDAAALAARVRVAGALGATWSRHGARVQPAKLAQGLADAVERLGVTIHEGTAVREIEAGGGGAATGAGGAGGPPVVRTDRGSVRAPVALCCLEGFTAGLHGERRRLLPLTSAMVVTEPLSAAAWEAIGWHDPALLGDAAHAFVYAQRTAGGRIALGGRGAYRYGSRTDRAGRVERRTVAWLTGRLRELFPPAAGAAIDHAWCGAIGVARDWTPAVRFDPATGVGTAGGYVGQGLGTSHLAGRTLRDLVLGEDSDLTRLPWVAHAARRWEPEPLRWLGASGVAALYRAADRHEAGGLARTSGLARAADRIAGR